MRKGWKKEGDEWGRVQNVYSFGMEERGNVNSSMERGICGIRGLGGGSWGVH